MTTHSVETPSIKIEKLKLYLSTTLSVVEKLEQVREKSKLDALKRFETDAAKIDELTSIERITEITLYVESMVNDTMDTIIRNTDNILALERGRELFHSSCALTREFNTLLPRITQLVHEIYDESKQKQ